MAAVIVNPDKVREFKTADHFYVWLGKHHDKEDELWIKIHKLDSGLTSSTPKEAIDVVLCWGWIDGVKKSLDNKSYLQRYTPRRNKSIWSQVNVLNVARIPDDLQAAIDAKPQAREMFQKLSTQNRFALAFRIHNLKTEAIRRKKIATFVEMLVRGETIYPQGNK